MLKEGTGFSRVIICCGRVDLRKGIPGLSAYVRLNYGLDAAEKGTLFLFCGNRTNCIKGLLFEGDGMLLLTKKLFAGNRFQWPRTPDEARELTPELVMAALFLLCLGVTGCDRTAPEVTGIEPAVNMDCGSYLVFAFGIVPQTARRSYLLCML